MLKRMGLIVALLLTAALVAACGGGGDNDAQPQSSTSSNGEVQRIEVSGTDFAFTPQDVVVQRGTPVEIVFTNDGRVAHDWAVDQFNAKSPVIAPGRSTTISFTPTQAGEFKIVCKEPGHEAAGMVGTLIVQ